MRMLMMMMMKQKEKTKKVENNCNPPHRAVRRRRQFCFQIDLSAQLDSGRRENQNRLRGH